MLTRRRPNLRDEERQAIFEQLLELSHDKRLPHGAIGQVAAQWGRERDTIARICARGQQSRLDGHAAADVKSKMQGIELNRT